MTRSSHESQMHSNALRVTDPRSGRKLGHDAVRPNHVLPDLFENLAGDHGEIADCRLPIAEFVPMKNPACASKSTE